ncbi:hypothetical protein Patl1_06143 [Pistacia atlantica]|uniref:Uncharacterized protein n=1 Tax=Pistacia atlantica TaxID=434234 RepID=A0ACC1BU55_9ROSI|nr:hypothetical protein Patl1_06143 [Pistacia atlantica]
MEQITIDGKAVKDPDMILSAGSELVYHRLPWKEPDAPYLLEVSYEDNDMIALNKPSGLQVLPGGLFQQRTVLKQLQWQASKQKSSLSNQESHPVPVHRLGRGTSGILLCAKTKLAKTCLAAYFADGTSVIGANSDMNMELCTRKISKIYRALVSGMVEEDEIIIKQPIGIMQYPGVAKGLYVATPSGKPALSKVKVLERDVQGNRTLVQVAIQSGRPHQIRIHLAFVGHPLVEVKRAKPKVKICDNRELTYMVILSMLLEANQSPLTLNLLTKTFAQDGGYPRPLTPVPGDCGYYLHAHQLTLSHPTTNEVIEVMAPLPSILPNTGRGKENYHSLEDQLGMSPQPLIF